MQNLTDGEKELQAKANRAVAKARKAIENSGNDERLELFDKAVASVIPHLVIETPIKNVDIRTEEQLHRIKQICREYIKDL